MIPAIVPGVDVDMAVECVFMFISYGYIMGVRDSGVGGSDNQIWISQSTDRIEITVHDTANPGGKLIQVPAVDGHWYHILVHWEWTAPNQTVTHAWVNGVFFASTAPSIATQWVGGPLSNLFIAIRAVASRTALARLWIGAPPAASLLYDLGYIGAGVYAELKCQWDMRPGYGNTAFDTTGLFDLPWVTINQPNAAYASYRYTGQCRADHWNPP